MLREDENEPSRLTFLRLVALSTSGERKFQRRCSLDEVEEKSTTYLPGRERRDQEETEDVLGMEDRQMDSDRRAHGDTDEERWREIDGVHEAGDVLSSILRGKGKGGGREGGSVSNRSVRIFRSSGAREKVKLTTKV